MSCLLFQLIVVTVTASECLQIILTTLFICWNIFRYGQPPTDIIKELAPELEFDDEGMPIMDPMGNGGQNMPPFMPGMPFPGGGGEECCIS